MSKMFAGEIVVVTGRSTGIGLAAAKRDVTLYGRHVLSKLRHSVV